MHQKSTARTPLVPDLQAERGRREGPLAPLMLHTALQVRGDASQSKEIKGIQTGKEDNELYLFKDYMIAYIENAGIYEKLRWVISELSQVGRYKLDSGN